MKMTANYTMKNGEVLKIFLYSDMLDPKDHFMRTNATYYKKGSKRENHLNIFFDEESKKKYFIYKEEQKYFDDFDYIPYPQLVRELNAEKSSEYISSDDILATFIKEPRSICVVADIGLENDRENDFYTIVVPSSYKKEDIQWWRHKIKFVPYYEEFKDYSPYLSYYFTDFCYLLRSGVIRLVEKTSTLRELSKEEDNYRQQIAEENKSLLRRIKGTIKRKLKKYNYQEKVMQRYRVEKSKDNNGYVGFKENLLVLQKNGIYFPVSNH